VTVYLGKLLAQLVYPLGLSLVLFMLSLPLLAWGRRRWAAGIVLIAVLWLGFWSLPVVSDALRASLERRFADLPVEALPAADVAVVLGGGIEARGDSRSYPDLGSAADRVWHAARLYRAGKVRWLILSGGRQTWQGERLSEAEAMRALLTDLGVPVSALLLEERSRTTRENALYSAELIRSRGFGSVLLVSSAMHMPRALAAFYAVGVKAVPAPTDFEVTSEPQHPLRWLPDAQALAGSTRALKEYLGWVVYLLRGWAVHPTG